MKTFLLQTIGWGLLLFGQPCFLLAQQTPPCREQLFLHNGSRFEGQLEELRANGDTVVFRLHTGLALVLPQNQVRRIVQQCKDAKAARRVYDFKEHGLYHHTRAQILLGQAYIGENSQGYSLLHSSGWMISRHLGVGLGFGAEFFDPKRSDAATYPVFAEVRSYLLPRRISPYVNVGAGWAFTGRDSGERWGYIDNWNGGWMVQTELGYRVGNHFSVHLGLRLQRKYREWTSVWGPESGFGTDRILNKRLVLGVGLLL